MSCGTIKEQRGKLKNRTAEFTAAILLAFQLFSFSALASVDIDRAEFEAFLDDFVRTHMTQERIPGVAFYMVKDGEEFLAKGYGFANLEAQTPMGPRETVLAIGSLTKLFTATACMQLVEEEKLELFKDVNTYLDAFKVDETFDQPITLATLLEHTDGFDVAHIGISARTPDDVVPLETYLATRLPPRVRPPGRSACYGEHGMALAGHLIETVSGVPYETFLQEELFEPLGMTDSGFRITPDLADRAATGYTFTGETFEPIEAEYASHLVPASGMHATAADMGRFMLVHLGRGELDGTRLFSEHTSDLMLEPKFGLHPMLSAWSYGFHSRQYNGEFCIEHGGMSTRSCLQLFMMPERQIGFVMAGNAFTLSLQKKFVAAFLERYVGPQAPGQHFDPADPDLVDPAKFEGTYASLHGSRTTVERVCDVARETRVTVTSPMSLQTESALDSNTWERIGPAVYETIEGDARIAFALQDDQVVAMLSGPHECRRLAWWETSVFFLVALAVVCPFFFIGALRPLLLLQAGRRATVAGEASGRRRVRDAAFWLMCTLNLLFLLILGYTIRSMDYLHFAFGLTPLVVFMLWLPLISTALTPAVIGFAMTSWVDREDNVLRRTLDTAIAFAGLGFLLVLGHWNMIGFNV